MREKTQLEEADISSKENTELLELKQKLEKYQEELQNITEEDNKIKKEIEENYKDKESILEEIKALEQENNELQNQLQDDPINIDNNPVPKETNNESNWDEPFENNKNISPIKTIGLESLPKPQTLPSADLKRVNRDEVKEVISNQLENEKESTNVFENVSVVPNDLFE